MHRVLPRNVCPPPESRTHGCAGASTQAASLIFDIEVLWIFIALDLNEALIFPLIDMHSQT